MSDRLELKERNGKFYAFGTFNGERIRKSLGTSVEATAKEQLAQFEAKLWKRHSYGDEAVRTFEEAALSYLKQGGEGRYVPKVLTHFKGRAVGKITPGEIRKAAIEVYPDAGPSTRNRQFITPARSIINHAHELGWCGAVSVKTFEVPKSRKNKPVDRAWLDTFLAESDRRKLPHLSALVLFMHQTGARISEAIRVEGDYIDLGKRMVVLEKTKTDEMHPRYLTAELVARIAALTPTKGVRIFGYTDRQAPNRSIKRICAHLGIKYHSNHAVGRHSFATNALKGGAEIKEAMDAGGWKSAALFMETYVHSDKAGRNVAAIFDRETGPIDANLAQAIPQRRLRFGNQKRK